MSHMLYQVLKLLLVLLSITPNNALQNPFERSWRDLKSGLSQRVAADPNFVMKSVSELALAAGTQLSAEWNRRGKSNLIPEIDFVLAGVLTAMAGKYYSMWRVAPTKRAVYNEEASGEAKAEKDATLFGVPVLTNTFQSTMLDGVTKPTMRQRLLSVIAPMPELFQAGIAASVVGYGVTGCLILLRSIAMPEYVGATRNVSIFWASIYTGAFMATVSNARYQLLQGIIEPLLIDKLKGVTLLYSAATITVRLGNGFLGSVIAISGMRRFGLQQLKK